MLKSNSNFATLSYGFHSLLLLIAGIALIQPSTAIGQGLKLKLDLTPPPREVQVRAVEAAVNGLSGAEDGLAAPKGIALPAQQKASAEELNQLAIDLGALPFRVRKAASDRLKTLTTEDMGKLADRLLNSPSAEALMRVHSQLEIRYQAESKAEHMQASRLLETMATQERLLSADPATHSLQKHWERRIQVAFSELEAMGAVVRNGNFSVPADGRNFGDSRPARQILLTKSWKGGDEGLEVFRRLEALAGPVRSLKGLNVYLLSGHPLNANQEKRLIDIVGANRIQYRSVVALGITADRMTQGLFEGVVIKGVSRGGSAEKAGLGSGDLLLTMYGPTEKVLPIKYDPEAWRTFRRPVPKPPVVPQRDLPPIPAPRPGLPPRTDRPIQLTPELEQAERDDRPLSENPNRLIDFDDLVERLKKYGPGDKVKVQVVRKFRSVQNFRPFPVAPQQESLGQGQDKAADNEKVIELEIELIGWADLPMAK